MNFYQEQVVDIVYFYVTGLRKGLKRRLVLVRLFRQEIFGRASVEFSGLMHPELFIRLGPLPARLDLLLEQF